MCKLSCKFNQFGLLSIPHLNANQILKPKVKITSAYILKIDSFFFAFQIGFMLKTVVRVYQPLENNYEEIHISSRYWINIFLLHGAAPQQIERVDQNLMEQIKPAVSIIFLSIFMRAVLVFLQSHYCKLS